jgi:YetA-like protein
MAGAEPFSLEIHLQGGDFRAGPQPVRMGIPLPQGRVREADHLRLSCPEAADREILRDLETLARWPDGSVKWALLRFLAESAGRNRAHAYRLTAAETAGNGSPGETLALRHTADTLEVDTGRARFAVDKAWLYPIRRAECGGTELLAYPAVPELLIDAAGRPRRFKIRSLEVEHAGQAQADVFLAGDLVDASGSVFCRGECRLFFFAGTALVKMEFALWNPKPAKHPGGLWDLGDSGSIFFRRLGFAFPLAPGLRGTFAANLDPADGESWDAGAGPLSVHQSGPGSDAWQSLALVDRHNHPTPRFQGYRFSRKQDASEAGDTANTREGKRANPVLVFRSGPAADTAPAASIALALESFWQTFPNRLAAQAHALTAEPFPAAEAAEFELQGGEMATSTLWLDFAAPSDASAALACARTPAVPSLDTAAYGASGSFPYLSSPSLGGDAFWNGLGQAFLDGPNGIQSRRERFAEFGWRNYGEIPADHEREHYQGSREFISHYNNQYDWILAALLQFAGNGDARWFTLAAELGAHVMHVDLYRTEGDKSAYNGGYFWHTAHYMHAGTATHRSYSRLAVEKGSLPAGFGGGPSNEHNYTTGLLLYFYLSGDRRARRCLLQLAGWVERMQDGSKTVFRFLSANPTGFATATRDLAYQGPGRGGGYSINACLDAAALTGEKRWLDLAERYLRICLGPGDDPDALELMDRERRWSYVVFLQSLGKFLDLKLERGERDAGFDHARACLLKLADWMAEKEYPYLDRPGELEFPTSTWAAQDLRKVCVFLFAAKYGRADQAAGYRAKADFFLAASRRYLEGYPDRDSVRNLVLAFNTLPMHGCAEKAAAWNLGLPDRPVPSLPGQRFVPQKIAALANAKKIVATLGLAALPILFQVWRARRARRSAAGGR